MYFYCLLMAHMKKFRLPWKIIEREMEREETSNKLRTKLRLEVRVSERREEEAYLLDLARLQK